MKTNDLNGTVGVVAHADATTATGSGVMVTASAIRKDVFTPSPAQGTKPFSHSSQSEQLTRRSITDWAREISQARGRGPANILALARLVSQARVSLRHGEWSRLWRAPGIGFLKKNADRLVTIGEGLGAANETNWTHLPSSMRALYYLAHLGWPTVKRLIEKERIHPGMTETGARALLAEFHPEMAQKTRRITVEQWLARVADSAEEKAASWSPEERKLAQAGLLRLAELVFADTSHGASPIDSNGCRYRSGVMLPAWKNSSHSELLQR